MIKVCLTINDIGSYKLNRVPMILGTSSETVNGLFTIPFAKKIATKMFDYKEYLTIRKIKAVAEKYGCPITWAVVPIKFGKNQNPVKFSKGNPESYKILTKYASKGDEIIQEGTYASADEFSKELEDPKIRIDKGFNSLKEDFPGVKKIMQAPKWRMAEETIKALQELEYSAVLGGNIIPIKVQPLKTTYQIQVNKTKFSANFFTGDIIINLVMNANNKLGLKELERWLDLTSVIEGHEFVTCSEAIK